MGTMISSRYSKNQSVVVTPPGGAHTDARDADVSKYVGQRGTVIEYWWVDSARGDVFYIYKVRLNDGREVVLHEDELHPGKM
jgi:hypothetical protein